MEIKFTIKLDENTEITLSEEQAKSLHVKLEELFGKKQLLDSPYVPMYPYYPPITYTPDPLPDYTQYPIITCNTDGKAFIKEVEITVPFMREVEPFTKDQMKEIREELEAKTTTDATETTWVNTNDIMFKGPRSVDWTYYGGTTMPPIKRDFYDLGFVA